MASFELGFFGTLVLCWLTWAGCCYGFQDQTFYYENIEGGHGGAADNKQRATWRHPRWEAWLCKVSDCMVLTLIPKGIYGFI